MLARLCMQLAAAEDADRLVSCRWGDEIVCTYKQNVGARPLTLQPRALRGNRLQISTQRTTASDCACACACAALQLDARGGLEREEEGRKGGPSDASRRVGARRGRK